jgi:uncharacterized membrane protein YfcA
VGGAALSVLVGFVSGVLSGAFGIGGGLVTTPAIRLVLAYPALVAVGTPLPVILPGAITGAASYLRRGLADTRAGLVIGVAGAATSVAGALFSATVGGTAVLLATAALILWAGLDLTLQARDAAARRPDPVAAEADPALDMARESRAPSGGRPWTRFVVIGLVAGAYSGFFGLGGGFIVVPALTRFCSFTMKRAIGTSLVAIAVLAIPGTLAHAALGHVDWSLAGLLAVGVVPGAWIGARLTAKTSDAAIRVAFAGFLCLTGIWLAVSEIAGLAR